jgi:hypothetical protein
MTFAENLGTFFQDFGVTAVWNGGSGGAWTLDSAAPIFSSGTYLLDGSPMSSGAVTAQVIFDQVDSDLLTHQVQSRNYKIGYVASDFVGLSFGDSITVNDVAYSVIQVNSIDDGQIFEAILERT